MGIVPFFILRVFSQDLHMVSYYHSMKEVLKCLVIYIGSKTHYAVVFHMQGTHHTVATPS